MIYRAKNESTGIPFTVRVVREGEAYGMNDSQIHDSKDPLVEFYDGRYDFDRAKDGSVLGQFVSRYALSTLEGRDGISKHSPIHDQTGIDLQGGVDSWSVDADFMRALSQKLSADGLIDLDRSEECPSP